MSGLSPSAAPGATLFLCGDLMCGRGIDQILPHPCDPQLFETCVQDARDYVALAEARHGPIARLLSVHYPWGVALRELALRRPQLRIVNLETAVTLSASRWPKGIHYRMHPRHLGLLTAAGIDACVLANNHVLDWQREGLSETLRGLHAAGIATAGAGADAHAAEAPAVLALPGGGRVLLFAAASDDCGVPEAWAATRERSGVARLPDLAAATLQRVAARVRAHKRAGDIVLFSIHWGGNWGYAIPPSQRAFAHGLIETAGVDLVHGHSSHHVKALEIHRGRLILYGCGDLLNDYEGISGYAEYRGDLGLMYFPRLAADGGLLALDLVPTRIRHLRIGRPDESDRHWLQQRLQRECQPFGAEIRAQADGAFALRWR